MNIYRETASMISPIRIEILKMVREEMHPEQLGRELNVTRQAVDKHLSILYKFGLIDKRIKAGARPMVFYRITREGEEFLQNFEELVEELSLSIRKRYKEALFTLDRMLVDGEITEREYKQRKISLKNRFGWVMKE